LAASRLACRLVLGFLLRAKCLLKSTKLHAHGTEPHNVGGCNSWLIFGRLGAAQGCHYTYHLNTCCVKICEQYVKHRMYIIALQQTVAGGLCHVYISSLYFMYSHKIPQKCNMANVNIYVGHKATALR